MELYISVTVDCLQFLLWGEDRTKFIYGMRNMKLCKETLGFRNDARINVSILTFKGIISNLIALMYTQNEKVLLNCHIASVHVLFHI